MPVRLALLAAVCLGLTSGLGASGPFDNFSVRVSPGIMFNLGGRYSDYFKFNDVIDLGGGLNLGLRYEVNKNIYLEAAYGYNVLGAKGGGIPFLFRHGNSYFDVASWTLNASLYLKSGYPIEPYLTIGGGLYPWQFRSRLFGGNTWPAPANPQTLLKDTSPGLSIGLGAEANLLLNLTATFEIKYIYIFSRDVARYLTDDFTQMDYLGIGVGIIYYFKRK